MKYFIYSLIALVILSCTQKTVQESSLTPDPQDFDTIVNGDTIQLFELENANGIKVCLTNYGSRIVSVVTPDKNGEFADIAFGYSTIKEYLSDMLYSGPIVGRFANRIKDAKFILDDEEYNLFKNDGNNTLHGGKKGLNARIWKAYQDSNSVTMTYLSPDGEEGYPGEMVITNVFTLTDNNELRIEYFASTDKPTVINLSNHTLWNLKGEGDSTILDHYFMINADYFTPIDNEWIPYGKIESVEGTALDFREGKLIGQNISDEDEQLLNGLGYDHNWVLNKDTEDVSELAAKLWEKSSGRLIEIYTSEPGLQLYSGNFLDGSVSGKSKRAYLYRSGLIFETQHFPDSPNNPDFPSTVLRPGEKYYQLSEYRFKIMDQE